MTKFLALFFLFFLSIFLFLSSGVIDSQDGLQYLAVARNIYYTGEPTAPIYEFDQAKNIHMSTFVGQNGKTYSPTGLGYSLAFIPAVFLTDIFYKIYSITPSSHFPLNADWMVLLFASFINSFFAAGLALVLFLYLLELKIPKKQALLLTTAAMFTTNLLVYAKHSFAHMMFTFFLTLSFYLLKKYSAHKRLTLLFYSGISFGIMSITYNQIFVLTIIPYLLYYSLLTKPKLNYKILKPFLYFILGVLPFGLIYLWFETLRASGYANSASITYLASTTKSFIAVPLGVLFEGIWSQLFSPGRSFFLYSPILLIIIFFWYKIKSSIYPELINFLTLSIIFLVFFATQYATGNPSQGIATYWHGESSWGPRYLIPLIPFGMLIVAQIYLALSMKIKKYVFYPLLIIGLYIEILGVLMPYQVKFHNLEHHFFINSTEFTASTYSNLIPRFSSVFMMSKKLNELISTFPKTLNHGPYNVRFYDGVDFTFPVGSQRWRVIDGKGYIYFDDIKDDPVKKISFGLINHPVGDATNSAILQFSLNNKPIGNKNETLNLSQRKIIEIPLNKSLIKDKNNLLIVDVDFQKPLQKQEEIIIPTNRNLSLLKVSPQILGLISMEINNQKVNLESIDFPYVSPFGPTMTGKIYNNYGGLNQDPWKFWHIHTQIYERTPDFWWIKPLFYWDLPKSFFLILFAINITSAVYFGYIVSKKKW